MRKLILPVALPAVLLPAILLSSLFCLAAPPGKWVEARSENFIVVTNAGEGQARKTAIQFEQIRALFRDSLPYVKAHRSPTVTIFAVKDESSLQGLLPEIWADKRRRRPPGIFASGFGHSEIAIDINAQGLNPYKGVYHEYYHSVTVPYMPHLPLWVIEGTADFWGNSYIEDKQADVGVPDEAEIAWLRQTSLMPVGELFKVDEKSPYYNEENRASVFYSESWALIHYLMMADNGAHRAEFGTYLAALSQGATQDQAVAKAFGSLAKLQDSLNAYVHGERYFAIHVPPPPKPPESEIRVRSLAPSEVSAYFGGFLVASNQFMEAEPLLNEAAQLDPKLAMVLENLGMLHYARQENAEAATALSKAIALGSTDAMTRYLRAELAYNSGPHDNPQIEEDLRRAIALNPDLAEADSLLSAVLSDGDSAKLEEALSLAQKAVALQPGIFSFRFAVAQILARMHRLDDAELLARNLQAIAPDKASHDGLNQILIYVGNERANAIIARQNAAAANNAAEGSAITGATGPATDSAVDGPRPVFSSRSRLPSAEGRVTQVSCNRDEMQLTLAPADGSASLVFHVKDVNRVNYVSDVSGLKGSFTPCTDLQGHGVKITYTPPAADTFHGELAAVEITK